MRRLIPACLLALAILIPGCKGAAGITAAVIAAQKVTCKALDFVCKYKNIVCMQELAEKTKKRKPAEPVDTTDKKTAAPK